MLTLTTDANFQSRVVSNPRPSVVLFGAVWCAPCKAAKAALLGVVGQFPGADFFYCDVDVSDVAAADYLVSGVPCIVFISGGELITTFRGAPSAGAMAHWIADALID